MQTIALFFLASVAVGGIAWVFLYPILSGERKTEQRMASVARTAPVARTARGHQKSRRDQVEATLKEFEERHKKSKNPPLSVRIAQAGLTWSKRQFMMISAGIGVVMFLAGIIGGGGLLVAAGLGFAGAFGIPRWLLSFLKKRREAKFLNAFPDAVDIIVRGVKAGLPVLDCLKVITNESPEPVKSEFRTIVETQAIGMPLGDACMKLYEDMPVPEANFFGIVVAIQQRSGGNLAEALGNLSRVLRDRKKMKAKIRAMSQEAKSSAAIIETQAIGMPLGEACLKLYEDMPVPEANFFGIVISIQQKAGGNLAEALGNLSRVLRDRKKMKAKIQAMSQEAKASASIIGALPVAVMTLVYVTSPQYISLLWTEPLGRVMLAASAVWMFMGVMVMKKMINFDF